MYNNSRRGSGGFKSGGFKGGGGKRFGGGGGRDGGFREGGRPQMHPATCSQCGNSCEVPFRPNGSKPIFCSNCFKRDEGGTEQRSEFRERKPFSGGNSGGGNDASVGLQLKMINEKLDALLEIFTSDEGEDEDDAEVEFEEAEDETAK